MNLLGSFGVADQLWLVSVAAGKRCYVGNLAWKTSWQDLKDLFRSVGTVVYSNVMVRDLRLFNVMPPNAPVMHLAAILQQ